MWLKLFCLTKIFGQTYWPLTSCNGIYKLESKVNKMGQIVKLFFRY